MQRTFAVAVGGAAGDGAASVGAILSRVFARRGLHVNAYNAFQSIIRGGHTLWTIRTGVEKVTNYGDRMDMLIPLNQDTMNRHLGLLGPGAAVLYNSDTIRVKDAPEGVQVCGLPVGELTKGSRLKVAQNTVAMGAGLSMMGVGFQPLEARLTEQFQKKGEAVVAENVEVAKAGYQYANVHFKPYPDPLPMTEKRYAVVTGQSGAGDGGCGGGGCGFTARIR